jgi:hypothetical protein
MMLGELRGRNYSHETSVDFAKYFRSPDQLDPSTPFLTIWKDNPNRWSAAMMRIVLTIKDAI